MYQQAYGSAIVSLAAVLGMASCGGEAAYREPEPNHATLRVERSGVVRDISLGPDEVICRHMLDVDTLSVGLLPASLDSVSAGMTLAPLAEASEKPGEPGRYLAKNRASGCENAPICCIGPCLSVGWTVEGDPEQQEYARSGLREEPCSAEVLDENHGFRIRFVCEGMDDPGRATISMWGEAYCATSTLRIEERTPS